MKKTILIATTAIFILGSCKKESPEIIFQDKLLGKWKAIEYGEDIDNDGILDPGETELFTDADGKTYFTFQKKGNGFVDINAPDSSFLSQSFQWFLSNNNNTLNIAIPDTIQFHIKGLDGSKLILLAADAENDWIVFQKQL